MAIAVLLLGLIFSLRSVGLPSKDGIEFFTGSEYANFDVLFFQTVAFSYQVFEENGDVYIPRVIEGLVKIEKRENEMTGRFDAEVLSELVGILLVDFKGNSEEQQKLIKIRDTIIKLKGKEMKFKVSFGDILHGDLFGKSSLANYQQQLDYLNGVKSSINCMKECKYLKNHLISSISDRKFLIPDAASWQDTETALLYEESRHPGLAIEIYCFLQIYEKSYKKVLFVIDLLLSQNLLKFTDQTRNAVQVIFNKHPRLLEDMSKELKPIYQKNFRPVADFSLENAAKVLKETTEKTDNVIVAAAMKILGIPLSPLMSKKILEILAEWEGSRFCPGIEKFKKYLLE
jgi:hypothetical protein